MGSLARKIKQNALEYNSSFEALKKSLSDLNPESDAEQAANAVLQNYVKEVIAKKKLLRKKMKQLKKSK